MTCSLLKGLKEYRDLDISAIFFNDGRLASEVRRIGIPVYVLPETELSFFHILRDLKAIFKDNPPDIIHAHRYKENILSWLATRSHRSIQLIATQHGLPEIYGRSRNLKYRLLSRLNFLILSKYFYSIVAVSRDIEDFFVRRYGFPREKVRVIHNGIEIPQARPSVNGKNRFVIGSTGRYVSVKDFPFMVEVAKEVTNVANDIYFEIAGEGPHEKTIEESIRKNGLEDRFLLRGLIEDISSFYQGLDLYINTSLHEGIPMSILEAMGHMLPVVVPNVGGFSEILEDGVQGYLVNGRDPRDFSEKCIELYEKIELRKRMGIAGRQKVLKEFSSVRMAQRHHSLYMNAVNRA